MRIELHDIHKYYGESRANNGISLTIEPGTIHGILGENGAGKSTLMKIMAGTIRKNRGTIRINDTDADYSHPDQAMKLGLGMLYQDPLDFLSLTVLDNFMLGQSAGVRIRKGFFQRRLSRLSEQFDFSLNPDALLKSLTIGERQQLELLRLLSLGVEALILDEPTTGISSLQKDTLFNALKALAAEGKSIILVSHKLEDVETLCSQVTVLRQGRVSGNMTRPFSTQTLLEMIFGTPPAPPVLLPVVPGDPILVMDAVSTIGGRCGLKNCSTLIREGEIIGLAGLEGSGQELFLRLASGIKKPTQGTITLNGIRMNGRDHHAFKDGRVVFMPSARLEEGLIPGLSIAEHVALQNSQKGFFVRWREWLREAEQRITRFHIKGKPDSMVETLSGGNQQRLLLSLLPETPRLLLLENPTRGLDVESTHWIWEQLQHHRRNRAGIVFSSTELDEILMIAHRILVFFDGQLIKDVDTSQTNIQELGKAIAGKH
ncbi:MAG: ATP-binding cassette domain-containing protein [Deltaproteobacteria bacterium]|nr:ATP-binding cassette domain-containing protein [Deltaproteobacteria bacterium]